jgi:hypothetical protein
MIALLRVPLTPLPLQILILSAALGSLPLRLCGTPPLPTRRSRFNLTCTLAVNAIYEGSSLGFDL